jgi:hypothetical protein
MNRWPLFIAVVVVSCVGGYAVWLLTDSTTASYIVGVVGTAVGIAALVVTRGSSDGSTVSSLVRARNVDKSVTGIDDETETLRNLDSRVHADDVKGPVTGIKLRKRS